LELSEFEKKYKLLLNKLDMNENRLDALKTPEKKEAESEEASRRLSAKNPEKLDGGQGEGRFPSRLKTTLEPHHSPDQLDRLPVRVLRSVSNHIPDIRPVESFGPKEHWSAWNPELKHKGE